MTARLLPYDAIKQNNPCAFAHAFREPSARLRRAAPLRVNDVTIMSPSRIITIAADTDLYNFERNPTGSRQGAAAISSTFPNCTLSLLRASFPKIREIRDRKEKETGKDLFNISGKPGAYRRNLRCRCYFAIQYV